MKARCSQCLPAIPEKPQTFGEPVGMRIRPSQFRTEIRKGAAVSGMNVLEALRWGCRQTSTPIGLVKHARVFVNGVPVARSEWESTVLHEHDFMSVTAPMLGGGGGGGKNPLRTILTLVVAVAAMGVTFFAPFTAPAWMSAASFNAMIGGAIMMGGMLLVNAICPATPPKLGMNSGGESESASRIWSLEGAQNKADPYGAVPTVLGRVRYAPRFASQPYCILMGDDQYVRYLFVVSTGDCIVRNPRIGETNLSEYDGVEWHVYRNATNSTVTKWFDHAASLESLSIAVEHSGGWYTRTTARDCTKFQVFLVFEGGLKRIDDQGNGHSVTVRVQCRYRKVNGDGTYGGWIYKSGTKNVSSSTAVSFSDGWIGVDDRGMVCNGRGVKIADYTYTLQTSRKRYYHYVYGHRYRTTKTETWRLTPVSGFSGQVSFSSGGSQLEWTRTRHTEYGPDGYYWVGGGAAPTVYASGSVTVSDIEYSGCTINPKRKTITVETGESAQWEVSICRVTGDPDADTTRETTRSAFTWGGLQSFRSVRAFVGSPRYPMTLLELQIKSTEQLNGTLDEFNVEASSMGWIPAGEDEWAWRETANPASLYLRVACGGPERWKDGREDMQSDISKPALMSEMDEDSIRRFYTWCQSRGWAYNAVLTGKTNGGEVVHNILSAGRGSYAMLNGHGVVWDDPANLPVVDMFTQRNSWGFSAKKALVHEPVHGLRMRFLNEEKDWQEDERVVYADGRNAANATNIIEWEQDGVTSPALIWKHGRLRLAELALRPEVYTLNVEAESITIRRGDKVRVLHDATFWGITSAAVVKVNKNGDGLIESIELDDWCPMDAGKRYGIRFTNWKATDCYLSVETEAGAEVRTLRLSAPVSQTETGLDAGDVVGFGRTESVGATCIVLSVTPQEDFCAQLTLCDAAENLYEAIDENDIPDWDSKITVPTRYQAGGKPRAPKLLKVVSDETVLRRTADGTLHSEMHVTYTAADQPAGVKASGILLYARLKDSEDRWRNFSTSDISDDTATVVVPDVIDGKEYEFKAQTVSLNGISSSMTALAFHTVVGKTSRPPAPLNLTAAADGSNGILLDWDNVDVLDLKNYRVWGVDAGGSGLLAKKKTVEESLFLFSSVVGKTGALTFFVEAVDVIGLVSETPASVTFTVNPPPAPDWTIRAVSNGVLVEWEDSAGTWPVSHYVLVENGRTYRPKTTQQLIPLRSVETYTITMHAVDVFRNAGPDRTKTISIGRPEDVTGLHASASADGIELTWNASDWPLFFRYEVSYAGKTVQVKTNSCTVKPWGLTGAIAFSVVTLDTNGMTSEHPAAASFTVEAPAAVECTGTLTDSGYVISWTDACKRTWDIAHFILEEGGKTYRLTGTTLAIPLRKHARSLSVSIHAVDVFKNGGAESAQTLDFGLPPNVQGLTAETDAENGIRLSWDAVECPAFDCYKITGAMTARTADTSILLKPCGLTGDLQFNVVAYDKRDLCSETAASVTVHVDPPSPVFPEGTTADASSANLYVRFEKDGAHVLWTSCMATWSLKSHAVTLMDADEDDLVIETYRASGTALECVIPPLPLSVYDVRGTALDIFGNESEETAFRFTVAGPQPVTNFRAAVYPPAGVRFTWTAAPGSMVDHYRVYRIEQDGTKYEGTTKTTSIVLPVPNLTGTNVMFCIAAVDVWGLESQVQPIAYVTIYPPRAMEITAETRADGVYLHWQNCRRTWPVREYSVTDDPNSKTYAVTTEQLVLPLRARGCYTVTAHAMDIFENDGPETVYRYLVTGPATVTGFRAKIDNPSGVTLTWDKIDSEFIRGYRIKRVRFEGDAGDPGAGTFRDWENEDFDRQVSGNSVTIPMPGQLGRVWFRIVAVDMWNEESAAPSTAYADILAPAMPVITGAVIDNKLQVDWQSCQTSWNIDHYTVYDVYRDRLFTVKASEWPLSTRTWGSYEFHVTAYDIFGNMSAIGVGSVTVSPLAAPVPTVSIDGADFLISWPLASGPFTVAEYFIKDVNGTDLGKAKTNFFRFPARPAGTHGYRVRARDISGNESAWGECSITTHVPDAPSVSASLSGQGIRVKWSVSGDGHELPVAAYDLVRQHEVTRSGGLTEVEEEDYGRISAAFLDSGAEIVSNPAGGSAVVCTYDVDAVKAGTHTFLVRAVDSAGNLSAFGQAEFEAVPPGRVTFDMPSVIDNNVMLYWSEPRTVFFPIEYYNLSYVEDGISALIGRVDARFATVFEEKAGTFQYRVCPVDAAGNVGECTDVAAVVSQPPDFIFYNDYDSLFNGTKTNFVLDGKGKMIGPYADQTWNGNSAAVAELLGMQNSGDLTWKQKHDGGYQYWMSPKQPSGEYVEVVDAGALVPSTKITVTFAYDTLEGSPEIACKIETSQDNANWSVAVDNGFQAYATEFRYARYTFTVTGGTIAVKQINYLLNVKQIQDFGQVWSAAGDNGEGFASVSATPDLYGTWVPFKTAFVDVQSGPICTVVSRANGTAAQAGDQALVNFKDVLLPSGFRVWAVDRNGNRIAATIAWQAFGV